jgi:hypothetical protein
MAIPDIPISQLEQAFKVFDRKDFPGAEKYENFLSNRAHKWAIRKNGKSYPVKQIIRLALGDLKFNNFSGGPEANKYMKDRKYVIIPKMGRQDSGMVRVAEPAVEKQRLRNGRLIGDIEMYSLWGRNRCPYMGMC